MKRITVALISVSLLMIAVSCKEKKVQLKEEKDKISYSIGMDIGKNFKQQGIDVNATALATGIHDALTGTKPLLTEEQIRDTMTAFQQQMISKQSERFKQTADKNKTDGEAFLAANKIKEGVKSLPDGLQYKVLASGAGKSPKETDTVTTNYRGRLIDGKEFDSSYERGNPVTFPVKGVIPGWTEALQLMKEGDKWEIYIPSELAYGARGKGPIGPNSTLIFEIELIKVAEGTAAAAAPGAPAVAPAPAKGKTAATPPATAPAKPEKPAKKKQ